jgi:hypothetical protein
METDNRTDPELMYWIPKYILMQNNKPFSLLGYMTKKMCTLAESQDKIGWRNFTKGYISSHFYNIQRFHLLMSSLVGKSVRNSAEFHNYSKSGPFELQNFHRNFIFLIVKCVPANSEHVSSGSESSPAIDSSNFMNQKIILLYLSVA